MYEIPSWEVLSGQLRECLGYSDSTLERTASTYKAFVNTYIPKQRGDDAAADIKSGIEMAAFDYGRGAISKDMLVRLRRIAFRMLMLIKTGTISWQRSPYFGKRFGSVADEQLISQWTEASKDHYSSSILDTYSKILRQYALYCLDSKMLTS